MEIRHLSLRNIRSYERAELDLPSGTTLIAGDVGAGKTSLLYAVEMALFGFAAVDAPFLIRHGAVHAEVSVTLEGGGHRYEVGRRFRRVTRRGHDSFEIERLTFSQDGARTVYSATELRQRVIDLFGFPDNPNPRSHSDLWRWAVYVPQERMREVLSQDPHERLETVRRALGVERYRLAADNAQDAASEIRQLSRFRREESDRLTHWESELVERNAELERFEIRAKEIEDAVVRAEGALAQDRKRLEQVEAERHAAEGDRREQDGLEREQHRDRDQAASIERALGAANAELAREPPGGPDLLAGIDSRIALLESELRRLGADRAEVVRTRAATEAQMRELIEARAASSAEERAMAEKVRQRSLLLAEVEHAQADLALTVGEGPAREPPEPTPRTTAEIERALEEARRDERVASDAEVSARRELEEVDHLLAAGQCPRCHQVVRPSDFAGHRQEAALALQNASEARRVTSEWVAQLEEERRSRERFERTRERWQEAERRRAGARERLELVSRQLTEVEEALTHVRERFEAARARVTSLAAVEEVEARELAAGARIETEAQQKARRLEEARRERQAVSDSAARRERRVLERDRLAADLAALRGRLAEREERMARLSVRTAQLERLIHDEEGARQRETESRQRLDALRVDKVRVEQDATNARRRRREAEEGVAERGGLLREIRDLDAKAAWLGGPFREALLQMEQRILSQAQASFQHDFARFFRALVDDPLLEARVGVGFDPTVLINGEWTPAEALSGGERTALALAFRVALGRVVRSMGGLKLDTLILDEPTDGFSPEQIVRMGELLRGLGLPQVVLVSHESQLSAVADHVAQAVKTNGSSTIVVAGRPAPEPSPPVSEESEPPARSTRRRSSGRGPAPAD